MPNPKRALQFLILAGMLLAGKSFALPSCSLTGYINTHCSGKKVYSEGTYVGDLQDGWPHGQGTYTWTDGRKYVGEWRDDKQNGQGTFTWSDGDKYVGEFRDGKKHGQGTYTWSDGDKYVGEWRDDRQYEGIQYSAAGKVNGTYSNGQWCSGCTPSSRQLAIVGQIDPSLGRSTSSQSASSSSSSLSGSQYKGWCVYKSGSGWLASKLLRSQCDTPPREWFGDNSSGANARVKALNRNSTSSQSASSSSSSNDPQGWCVYKSGWWQKSSIQKSQCQGANEYWFTSESAAQSKLNQLKSQSASSSSSNAPDDEPGLLLYFILLGLGILIFVFVLSKKSSKTKSEQESAPTDVATEGARIADDAANYRSAALHDPEQEVEPLREQVVAVLSAVVAQRQATESAEPEPAEPEPVQETPERDLDSSPQIDPASEITQPEIIETARIDETAEAAPEAETPTDLETRLEQRFEQMEQQIEEKEQVFEELNKALESRQAEDQRWKNAMLRKGRRTHPDTGSTENKE